MAHAIDELNAELGKLWVSIIERIDFDINAHTIKLTLRVKADTWIPYNVAFDGVASFYFVGGRDGARFDMERWDYAELSEMYFYEKDVNTIDYKFLLKENYPTVATSANFVLEIWSSLLLIEAGSITINGRRFDVGYPR